MGHLQVSASEHAGLGACYAVYSQAIILRHCPLHLAAAWCCRVHGVCTHGCSQLTRMVSTAPTHNTSQGDNTDSNDPQLPHGTSQAKRGSVSQAH